MQQVSCNVLAFVAVGPVPVAASVAINILVN